MNRMTIPLLLVTVLIPACNEVPMTRFEHEGIALEVGGRIEGGQASVAALDSPEGFARFGPVKQVMIEARILELRQEDVRFLGVQLWPGQGEPIWPSMLTDLSPKPVPITVGFGFDIGGGVGEDRGYEHRPDSEVGVGTGVGVGVPVTVGEDRGLTHFRATFPLALIESVDKCYLMVQVALAEDAQRRLIVQPMLMPMLVQRDVTPPVERAPQVATQVAIYDGETVVIGGLTLNDAEASEKVPIFNDLPVVGRLFRRGYEDTVQKDLAIFITPQIIVEPGE